jgi:O-acetyl-ADP-ribose deacetylase (regulator of RNase III)
MSFSIARQAEVDAKPRTHITFIDTDGAFVREVALKFEDLPDVDWRTQRVEELRLPPGPRRRVAYVSPANCLLFMDGGIDKVYSETMFPGLQGRVKRRLAEVAPDCKTALGRPFLPIGWALLTPVNKPDVFLLSAPTMTLPQDVQTTRNAYHAFMACLCAAEQAGIDVLIVPGLCTGWGKMPAARSAAQLREAYDDFHAGRRPPVPGPAGPAGPIPSPWLFRTASSAMDVQPPYYSNTEFRTIRAGDVTHQT